MNGIALIPARGGSRRIPRKNIRPFLGVPALARTIATVRAAAVTGRIVVSTDDDEIAEVARAAGAEVPGPRPDDLSDDQTSTSAVVRHAISAWFGSAPDDAELWVVYPSALLLRPEDLTEAAARFRAADAAFLVPVLPYPHPVERRLRLDDDGLLEPDEPARMEERTQDLRPAYHDAGQYYVGRIGSWRTGSPLLDPRSIGHEVALESAVDIDEPAHWTRAERLAELRSRTTGAA